MLKSVIRTLVRSRQFSVSMCARSEPVATHETIDQLERTHVRKLRKRRPLADPVVKIIREPSVVSMALAESLQLQDVMLDGGLNSMYEITCIDDDVDETLHFVKKLEYTINPGELSEIYVFRDGVVVFWNVESSQRSQVLRELERYAESPYDSMIVMDEQDRMFYKFSEQSTVSSIRQDRFYLAARHLDAFTPKKEAILERFALSQAFAASVKIGVWESLLNNLAEPLSTTTKSLRQGKIPWSRKEALMNAGEFAALRHSINLDCTLLNKDFYWERPELEKYYMMAGRHFSLDRRIGMLNKRLDYCEELVKMVDNTIALRHASHLEWMIIVLIVIEVIFDIFHFADKTPKTVQILAENPEKSS
ncbi:unnamed protein product [Caenorhabditis angaria]|uniref:DUF155 domain-containing protein n=1 Tax=Caenorhabditis angaria TaxID=860376 RepID=A0A9P1IGF3_9PELO|nr:unnamed protein product [Caenorhabditis angaria]